MADIEIIVSLPEELLREARAVAAKRQISLSQLVANELSELVARERLAYQAARQRQMARLEQGFDLGTHGQITWTRDELHERERSRDR
jgi:hypothetical protein